MEISDTAAKTDFRFSTFWGVFSGLLTALLWVLSIPPFEFSEGAYVAFVPLLLWLYTRPGWKASILVGFGTGWVSWMAIIIWLRHVTVFGTVALAAIMAAIFTVWVVLVRWVLPRFADAAFVVRLFAFLGLAGGWVVLEWSRNWFLWGFPWAPLSLSQWQRPVVLQIAAWTGAYGISFMLVLFSFCVAHTLRSRAACKERKVWTGWFSPDLYVAMGCLGLCITLFFRSLPAPDSTVPVLTAGVVQPYIAPELKWDEQLELENLETLEKLTRWIAIMESDLLLWPEASTPWPVKGYPTMQYRAEALVDEIEKPILMGNLAFYPETKLWSNGVYLVEPGSGLSDDDYTKRELVPFGEYVPKGFGFIEKVVPVGGNFMEGRDPGLIPLTIGEHTWKIGPLVCYEDTYAGLARESTAAGAQVFFVATNNAWYGEEGGAPQHAAHSVLRAVENRRPVMRCGNGGWSGWIDAYGSIRKVLLEDGSVYFQGGSTYSVFQYEEWLRRKSFYTRHGDWFVAVSAALLALTVLANARRRA